MQRGHISRKGYTSCHNCFSFLLVLAWAASCLCQQSISSGLIAMCALGGGDGASVCYSVGMKPSPDSTGIPCHIADAYHACAGGGAAPEGTDAVVRELLRLVAEAPPRPLRKPSSTPKHFLFAVDHCFALKGQGTVLTGTVLSGSIKVEWGAVPLHAWPASSFSHFPTCIPWCKAADHKTGHMRLTLYIICELGQDRCGPDMCQMFLGPIRLGMTSHVFSFGYICHNWGQVGSMVELPELRMVKKVKSIQARTSAR